MRQQLEELITLSRYAGSRPEYVQGGGGNTSVKLAPGNMLIKASGSELGEMSHDLGYVLVEYAQIIDGIHAGYTNDEFNALIRGAVSALSPLAGRPSIEAGFHAMLGRCVLHTHAVYANVLNCCVEGERLIRDLFADALLVGYGEPGLGITQAVELAAGSVGEEGVAFMQNHGVIVWGETADAVITKHESLNNSIRESLSLAEFDVGQPVAQASGRVLFPDQAVYLGAGADSHSAAACQTLAAAAYIETSLVTLGFSPRYLTSEQVNVLNGMESEKYRLQQASR